MLFMAGAASFMSEFNNKNPLTRVKKHWRYKVLKNISKTDHEFLHVRSNLPPLTNAVENLGALFIGWS